MNFGALFGRPPRTCPSTALVTCEMEKRPGLVTCGRAFYEIVEKSANGDPLFRYSRYEIVNLENFPIIVYDNVPNMRLYSST
jgi:hypothetical protein